MTLLIKSVQVLGSPEKLPERVDVFVSGDRISAIGNFPDKKAEEILDGQGAYLAPGFIDVNTDSDHYLSLFDNPIQDDFIRQGVTTIIGGHCGSSLAPLLYGSLESIQKWTDVSKATVDWHTMGEFLSVLARRPLSVNFMTLVGHSTIRRAMIGESLRKLTQNELAVFGETLRKAMDEGAAGFSTGLGYVHSRQTPYEEIRYLAKLVADRKGVYSTHLRKSGSELNESVDETIRIANETGARVSISHFLPIKGAEKEYEFALDVLDQLPKDLDINFDLYPFQTSVLPLYTFLPLWVQNGGIEVMWSNVQDGWMRQRILKDLPEIDPHEFIIAQARDNAPLNGQSLKELMDSYSLAEPKEALLKIMMTTKLRASIFYKNISERLIARGLVHPRSFISSNAGSLPEKRKGEQPERASRTFTKFLDLVIDKKLIPLEDAIRKITWEPARKFNLRNRGMVKEGYSADLTCFRDGGIKFTVVNGRVVYKDGSPREIFPGRVLKSGGY